MAMGVFIDVARRSLPFLPVFACIDKFIGTVKLVGGRSMQPTFNARGKAHNDAVVLDCWSARSLAYQRGDVVVLSSPHEPKEMLTKRIVGMPGDWVRPRAAAQAEASGDDASRGMLGNLVHVPRGQLWVEGDNEASSNDSNSFGCVAAALVEARVCFKIWPLNEAGFVLRRETAGQRLVHRGKTERMAGIVASNSGLQPWHAAR